MPVEGLLRCPFTSLFSWLVVLPAASFCLFICRVADIHRKMLLPTQYTPMEAETGHGQAMLCLLFRITVIVLA